MTFIHFFFFVLDEMAIPPGLSNNECIDHPLSDGPDSSWRTFFKDNEVLLQIDKDVRRLCPDISFFQQVSRCVVSCFRIKSISTFLCCFRQQNFHVNRLQTVITKGDFILELHHQC